MVESLYNRIAGQKVGRIEALSDGVFSIAMTFLVFNLKDPVNHVVQTDEQLLAALGTLLPNLLSFLLSFITLGIFWTGHATQFHFIDRSDRNLNWISIFFLMFASLLPFTAAILSNHIGNKVSIGLYWLNILAMGLLLLAHWNYAFQKHFISRKADSRLVHKAITGRIFQAQALYLTGTLLCFISTYLSIFFIIAVQLNYALALFTRSHQPPRFIAGVWRRLRSHFGMTRSHRVARYKN